MKKLLIFISLVFLVSCHGSLTDTIRDAQDSKYGSNEHIDATVVSVSSGKVSANMFYLYDIEHNGHSYTVFYSGNGDIFVIEHNK